MEQFQVSIGICIRNCEKTIDRVIHSIIQQDYPHKLMELIVVDDGSTDMTFNHVKRLTSKIGIYMKVYRQNWKGLGAARNIVVRNAKGKYIIWVDGDMELPKDHVRKQVEFMEKNPKVGAAKARYKSLNSAKNVVILENSRAFHFRSENSNIVIYNSKGQKVKTYQNSQLSAGTHSIVWNGTDSANKPVSSGIYYYKLFSSGKTISMNKMVLIK